MRISRKMMVISGGVVLLIVGGLWRAFASSSAVSFVTEEVRKGVLAQTVDVTGELQSAQEVTLAFGTTGTVASLLVDVGDTVQVGQTLAALDAQELAAAVMQAEQTVAQAQAELNAKNAGISDEEEVVERAGVAVAEAQVHVANIAYNNALAEQVAGDSADAATVAQSQSSYDQVAAQNTEAIAQATQDLENALTSSVIALRAGLEEADHILAIENTLFNEEYEDFVGVLDTTTMTSARDAYQDAAVARDQAEEVVLALNAASTATTTLAAYDVAVNAFSKVSTTLLYVSRMLDASVSQSGTFTNDDLTALQSAIATERSTVSSAQASLVAAKQTYDTVIREAENRYDDATNALALAKANQDAGAATRSSAVLRAQANVLAENAALAQAQAKLAYVLAKPRSVDVAGLEAAVLRAQAEYDAAMARYRQAQIVAPMDGIVTNIAVDLGEHIGTGEQMLTMIAANTAYEIVLDVPESDISQVQIGQMAQVTFDAFGDDTVFAGSVYSINPAQNVIEGVVFYETKVLLNDGQDLTQIKPGMSADVTIKTNHRESAVFVSSRAVLEKNNVSYVRIPKNAQEFEERSVTTGLRADDGLVEILSGLSEGETVILTVKSE